jgi:Peptidase family S51
MEKDDDTKQLLLISNSTLHGSGYLDHAEKEIRDFVGGRTNALFVPYAVHDRRAYATKAEERLREMGLSVTSIHDVSNMPRAVGEAEVIFVGGGNTFRLLKGLHDHDLLGPIRQRVAAGVPYRIERWLHRGLSHSENDERHARRPAPVIRGFGISSVPDQSSLPGPRSCHHAHG